jgi:hypothetical protein
MRRGQPLGIGDLIFPIEFDEALVEKLPPCFGVSPK